MATPLRPIADALFADRHGQPLTDWIADRRDEGKSWRAIARELADLTGNLIDVAPQTLINWVDDDATDEAVAS